MYKKIGHSIQKNSQENPKLYLIVLLVCLLAVKFKVMLLCEERRLCSGLTTTSWVSLSYCKGECLHTALEEGFVFCGFTLPNRARWTKFAFNELFKINTPSLSLRQNKTVCVFKLLGNYWQFSPTCPTTLVLNITALLWAYCKAFMFTFNIFWTCLCCSGFNRCLMIWLIVFKHCNHHNEMQHFINIRVIGPWRLTFAHSCKEHYGFC